MRPLHRQIGAAAMNRHAGAPRRRLSGVRQPGADRMRETDMGDASRAEEALVAPDGAVDTTLSNAKEWPKGLEPV